MLDETDVFMKQQLLDHAGNNLITIFLQKLKYYKGIMILTTNHVKDFNDAMQSRIHIAIKYTLLGADTRQDLWTSFLTKATTTSGAKFNCKDLKELAQQEFNS